LRLECDAAFARLEHALDDVARLIRPIPHRDQLRPLADGSGRGEILGEALGCKRNHGVRRVENGLRRSVVLFERDDASGRREQGREVEDVPDLGGPERVD
jgi:hypothetical protein